MALWPLPPGKGGLLQEQQAQLWREYLAYERGNPQVRVWAWGNPRVGVGRRYTWQRARGVAWGRDEGPAATDWGGGERGGGGCEGRTTYGGDAEGGCGLWDVQEALCGSADAMRPCRCAYQPEAVGYLFLCRIPYVPQLVNTKRRP